LILTTLGQMTKYGQPGPMRFWRRFLMSDCVFLSEIQPADSLASCKLDRYSPGMEPRKLLRADRKCSSKSLHGPLLCIPALPPPPTSRINWSRVIKLLVCATRSLASTGVPSVPGKGANRIITETNELFCRKSDRSPHRQCSRRFGGDLHYVEQRDAGHHPRSRSRST
jgi:hypothetical protein